MLMAVKERTRGISIRMATGARQWDIQRKFMPDPVLLIMVGGTVRVFLKVWLVLC